MDNQNDASDKTDKELELGTLLCKICNEVISTLPTSGVKKFYGLCIREECQLASKKVSHNIDSMD